MPHIGIRHGGDDKAVPHPYGRQKLFLLRGMLAQMSLNPQQYGLTGSYIEQKRHFAAWNFHCHPQRRAIFVTCTIFFLWEKWEQGTPEVGVDQKLGFIWTSLFFPLEIKLWRKVLGIIRPRIFKGLCEFSERQAFYSENTGILLNSCNVPVTMRVCPGDRA